MRAHNNSCTSVDTEVAGVSSLTVIPSPATKSGSCISSSFATFIPLCKVTSLDDRLMIRIGK